MHETQLAAQTRRLINHTATSPTPTPKCRFSGWSDRLLQLQHGAINARRLIALQRQRRPMFSQHSRSQPTIKINVLSSFFKFSSHSV